jgi:hypothetical protein
MTESYGEYLLRTDKISSLPKGVEITCLYIVCDDANSWRDGMQYGVAVSLGDKTIEVNMWNDYCDQMKWFKPAVDEAITKLVS